MSFLKSYDNLNLKETMSKFKLLCTEHLMVSVYWMNQLTLMNYLAFQMILNHSDPYQRQINSFKQFIQKEWFVSESDVTHQGEIFNK